MTEFSKRLPSRLPADERLLSLSQVLKRVPVSYRTIYRWMSNGFFPRNYQLGPNSVAWRESEIESWIAARPHTATAA